jgi:hypothetical protein
MLLLEKYMKKIIIFAVGLMLNSCATNHPVSDPTSAALAFKGAESIILGRHPAQESPEQRYKAFKYMIVDTTKSRLQAWGSKQAGSIAKICNAIGSNSGTDTMVYYLAFEQLNSTNEISSRLSKEVGPFYYRNLASMARQRLPNKLHDACTSGVGRGEPVGKDLKAIDSAMGSISDVDGLE